MVNKCKSITFMKNNCIIYFNNVYFLCYPKVMFLKANIVTLSGYFLLGVTSYLNVWFFK